jgi:hypothetical protein
MEEAVALGHRMLANAHLETSIAEACGKALRKRGRLFSDAPSCARLFMAWVDALAPERRQCLYPAVVAADCMISGYDLLDKIYDAANERETRSRWLPAGVTLLHLAQEFMRQAEAPAERRLAAAAALAHGGRRAFGGHVRDYLSRSGPPPEAATRLWIIRERSGSLAAASCAAAALVANGTWRHVGLAARFGRAYAVGAQLEDDLEDRFLDLDQGRRTIPTLLAASTSDAVVQATVWVLMRRSLGSAASILHRLDREGVPGDTAGLWRLLPEALHAPAAARAEVAS